MTKSLLPILFTGLLSLPIVYAEKSRATATSTATSTQKKQCKNKEIITKFIILHQQTEA